MPSHRLLVAYIPVLHRGYLQFFDTYSDVDQLYILDDELLKAHDYLRKELRSLIPIQQKEVLLGLGRFKSVELLNNERLKQLDKSNITLVMPDDDISHEISRNVSRAKIEFFPIFLRWDRRALNAKDPVNPDRTVSLAEFDHEVMRSANKTSRKSNNIWRRVGAAIVRDGKIISKSSNRHLPTDYSLWIDGDPRSILNKGVGLEVTTDMHAEAKLIANAAREGLSLKGANIYVTNFPCPPCAKLIAEAGFSKCYYSAGYAVLDGEDLLRAYEIELIHVSEPEDQGHPAEWTPYRK